MIYAIDFFRDIINELTRMTLEDKKYIYIALILFILIIAYRLAPNFTTIHKYKDYVPTPEIQSILRDKPIVYNPDKLYLTLEIKVILILMLSLLFFAIGYLLITGMRDFVTLYMCIFAIVINLIVFIYILLYKKLRKKEKYIIKCHVADRVNANWGYDLYNYVITYYDFINGEYRTFVKSYMSGEIVSRGQHPSKESYWDIVVEKRFNKLKYLDICNYKNR